MPLKGKKIIIGLTGGIACYKVPFLVRRLVKDGASVQIIMTSSATEFITPLTLETVSNNPVFVRMFDHEKFVGTRHIDLAVWPDALIIAPATANFIGKTASGVSDDLLTTVVCASPKPKIIVPAMNPEMWANPITQKNVDFLKRLNYIFIGPDEGAMACDSSGVGRMKEPEDIYLELVRFFNTSSKKKL